MNDELFTIPSTPPDALAVARAKYEAASRALDDIERDGGDDTGCATEAAEKALAMAEKELHRAEIERLKP